MKEANTKMSIEIFVLSDTTISSIVEWQHAIGVADFPLRLTAGPLDLSGGSLTVQLHDKPATLEYRVEDFEALRNFYKNISFGRDWKCVLALPWITGFDGLTAAWMAATAYARATNGAVFDPQEGRVFSPAEATKVVHNIERIRPEAEAKLQTFAEKPSTKSN